MGMCFYHRTSAGLSASVGLHSDRAGPICTGSVHLLEVACGAGIAAILGGFYIVFWVPEKCLGGGVLFLFFGSMQKSLGRQIGYQLLSK